MDSRRPAMIDTWLLAFANFAIFQGLILLELDRLASDSIWQLGYLTASVFCFAFWLALSTMKWWHRVGQTLLVVSTPLIVVWAEDRGTGGSWRLLAFIGTLTYAMLRLLRVRIAPHGVTDGSNWQWSLKDMLVAMVVVGIIYKLWESEGGFQNDRSTRRWEDVWHELGAYGVLASHGGLMILPTLWLLLRPHRLSTWRCIVAGVVTIGIAVFDCWLVGPLLNGYLQWPGWRELYDFWRRHVWQPQLAIVLVALTNGLTWRLLGWRLVAIRRGTSGAAPVS